MTQVTPITEKKGEKGKVCNTCNEWKPLSEYHFKNKRKNILRNQCKECKSIKDKEYKEKKKKENDKKVETKITDNLVIPKSQITDNLVISKSEITGNSVIHNKEITSNSKISKNKSDQYKRASFLMNIETLKNINIIADVSKREKSEIFLELVELGISKHEEYRNMIEDYKKFINKYAK